MEAHSTARPRSSASYLARESLTGLVLFACDALALATVSAVVFAVAYVFVGPTSVAVLSRESWLLMLLLFGYALAGLYPGAGIGPVEELRRLVTIATVFFLAMIAFVELSPQYGGPEGVLVVLAWILAVVFVPTYRATARHAFARRPWWGTPAVVIASSKTGEDLVSRLGSSPGLGVKVVAQLDLHGGRESVSSADGATWLRQVCADVERMKRERGVDYAILGPSGLAPERVDDLVRQLGALVGHIVVIPAVFGHTSIGIDTRDSGGVVGLHVRGRASLRRIVVTKRALDLVLAVFIALPALVVVLLAALAIMVVSPGNPFYRQLREGHRGRPIKIWKLRTMRRNADELLESYLEQNPDARAEWKTHYKLRKDPRVLPVVGHFLRRTSLDELPQIINVLAGSVSLVGPRPFPMYHLDQFDASFRSMRSSVVPGLTGWWQVESRSTADLVKQVELDSFYINNWSLWFDLYILARTPWAVLRGSGAS